jgi:glycosyltransferase involved in cell wall biosynthesis
VRILYPVPEIFPDPRARFLQIVNTCHALAREGHRVVLAAGASRGWTAERLCGFYDLPAHENLSFVRLPILRREKARFLKISWHGIFHAALLSFLASESRRGGGPAALFVRHIKLADFLLRWRRLHGLPVVFEIHEIFHLSTVNERRRGRIEEQERRVYTGADGIVTLSEKLRRFLEAEGFSGPPVRVIPHGVRPEWFAIDRSGRGEYVCYVGGLYRWKGVDTAVSAMRYLPGETLCVVGGGGRIEELKALAAREGVAARVRFAGAVPHGSVPGYLAKAKVALLPNVSEGPTEFAAPLKLVEYMAAGVPIVASDIPIYEEVVAREAEALLVPPGDPVALAGAVRRLAGDPALAVGIAARARARAEGFTYDSRARAIAGFLASLPPRG